MSSHARCPRTGRGSRTRRSHRRGAPGRPRSSRHRWARTPWVYRRRRRRPAAPTGSPPPPPAPRSAPGHGTGRRPTAVFARMQASRRDGGRVPHDPVVAETVRERESAEPRFVLPEQEEPGRSALAEYRAGGRQPNVLVILFDDVGLGRLRLLRRRGGGGRTDPQHRQAGPRGLLLTSCYSEPSCTPSRASLMTGRLPMRHGLLRPPMYGQPGGLDGEVTMAQLLCEAGLRHPGGRASGTWARTASPNPSTSASTTSTASSRCRTCTASGVTPPSSPRSSTARSGPVGREPPVQQLLRPRHPRRRDRGRRGGHHPRPLRAGPALGRLLARVHPPDGRPPPNAGRGSSTTAPGAPTSTTIPASPSSAPRRPSIPTRTPSSSSTTSWAGWWPGWRPPGSRGHPDLPLLGQRPRDGDLARRRLLALPLRQGIDLGGRPRVPGIVDLAGDDVGRPGQRRDLLADGPLPHRAHPGRGGRRRARRTATSTRSTRPRSCSTRPGSPTASTSTTGWSTCSRHSGWASGSS